MRREQSAAPARRTLTPQEPNSLSAEDNAKAALPLGSAARRRKPRAKRPPTQRAACVRRRQNVAGIETRERRN